MKPKEEVISDFNKLVNMTASELEAWLKSDDSNSAGWPKGDGGGESVGHDSGRKIVEILNSNPDKEPDKYTDEDVEHMRRVVAYCKRHLAQETKVNEKKTPEEIKKTKSYASLKNWGHDFLKTGEKGDSDGDEEDDVASDKSEKEEEVDDEKEESEKVETKDDGVDDDVDRHTKEAHAGTKRKQADDEPKSSKKRETQKGSNGDESSDGEIAKGDTVTWKWGGGHPQGKVLDVKEETAKIKSKNDNTITRHGKPEDPAVVLDTGKSKAVKLSHEVEREA